MVLWGLSGADYDAVSFAISDALARGAQRLALRPHEGALDLATDTFWTARNLVRFRARVSTCDFSPQMWMN